MTDSHSHTRWSWLLVAFTVFAVGALLGWLFVENWWRVTRAGIHRWPSTRGWNYLWMALACVPSSGALALALVAWRRLDPAVNQGDDR